MGLWGQAIGAGTNAILGLALQGHNDRRQLKQQGKLNEQQLGIDMRAMDYQQKKQLEMWKDTNYPAQLRMMKEAGLSPGLMYGMGGSGGATTGGGTPGVSAAKAPGGGSEIMGLQMLGAQKSLIEAQTAKTEAEAAKIAGVDTELATENMAMARIQRQLFTDTYEANFQRIMDEARIAEGKALQEVTQGELDAATYTMRIEQVRGELVGLGLANELKRVEKNLTEAEINKTIETVKQKWREVNIQEGRLALEKFVKDVADSTRLTVETASKVVNQLGTFKKISMVAGKK